SAFRGFLKPVLNRPNLRLETGVHVERVEFSEGRASAVVFTRGGERWRAAVSGEAILSAGAVGSPVLLEASGIGDGERLSGHGIDTVRHLPGVG
ncbi:GMC family oxidoreductase N-terminal domain-containing protein, partial [Acinetobacter baumannii]